MKARFSDVTRMNRGRREREKMARRRIEVYTAEADLHEYHFHWQATKTDRLVEIRIIYCGEVITTSKVPARFQYLLDALTPSELTGMVIKNRVLHMTID